MKGFGLLAMVFLAITLRNIDACAKEYLIKFQNGMNGPQGDIAQS